MDKERVKIGCQASFIKVSQRQQTECIANAYGQISTNMMKVYNKHRYAPSFMTSNTVNPVQIHSFQVKWSAQINAAVCKIRWQSSDWVTSLTSKYPVP